MTRHGGPQIGACLIWVAGKNHASACWESPRKCVGFALFSGTEKQPKHKVLDGISCGRLGGYLGGRPNPRTFTPSLGAEEIEFFARTSLT